MLTETEIARYHRDGWIVPDYSVPGDLLEEARILITGMIAALHSASTGKRASMT